MNCEKPATFTVSINDSFCTWEYQLPLPETTSIDMVIETLASAYGKEAPRGKFVAPDCRIKELEAALSLAEALLQYEREKNLRAEKSLGEARKLTVGGREW